MPTDTLSIEGRLDDDQYAYQLVKRLPGMRSVQRVPVNSVEQGIEAGTRYMSEAVRGEELGRWAKVQRHRLDDLVPRWVDCWEAP